MAVNLDEDGADLLKSKFRDKINLPSTSAKHVFKKNLEEEILIQNYQLA